MLKQMKKHLLKSKIALPLLLLIKRMRKLLHWQLIEMLEHCLLAVYFFCFEMIY